MHLWCHNVCRWVLVGWKKWALGQGSPTSPLKRMVGRGGKGSCPWTKNGRGNQFVKHKSQNSTTSVDCLQFDRISKANLTWLHLTGKWNKRKQCYCCHISILERGLLGHSNTVGFLALSKKVIGIGARSCCLQKICHTHRYMSRKVPRK